MFWPAEELNELKGTTVFDKIGKEDAEETYKDVVLPIIKVWSINSKKTEI